MKDKTQIYEMLDEAARRSQKLPSLRTIRARIGGGSLTRISDVVKEWQAQRLVDTGQMPEAFTEAEKEAIITAIWNIVRPIMGKRVEELVDYHTARIDLELNTAQRLKNEAIRTLEEAQGRNQEFEAKLREKDEKINHEVAQRATYLTLCTSLKTELIAAKKEIETLRKERDELLRQNAALAAENALLKSD